MRRGFGRRPDSILHVLCVWCGLVHVGEHQAVNRRDESEGQDGSFDERVLGLVSLRRGSPYRWQWRIKR